MGRSYWSASSASANMDSICMYQINGCKDKNKEKEVERDAGNSVRPMTTIPPPTGGVV